MSLRNEIPEMIGTIIPFNSGFALTDICDPRHQYISSLRHRFGEFLHKASVSLRQQGEENTVDAVHMLVSAYLIAHSFLLSVIQIRSIRTYMLEYGDSKDKYASYLYVSRA